MGKGSAPVIGYEYYLGVQVALTGTEIDQLSQLFVGEREAWVGSLTDNGSVFVDARELFGGLKREGGVAGFMTLCMGNSETQDPYLVEKIGANVPAYVGLATVIFKAFYWSAMNPYFKAPWFRIKRIMAGWSRGEVWYPEKIQIGDFDMNPAHIIYQSLTDTRFGMGYSPIDMNNTSFTTAADKLYDEGFGMSLIWDQQMTIEQFIQVVCNTINGNVRLDLRTGKFELFLIRDDYDIDLLPVLDPDNVAEVESFQRAAWGELTSEVTVVYTDRDQNQQSVTAQDLAALDNQGEANATSREYLGIRDPELAMRVAMRDLATASATLAQVSLVVNRVAWDMAVGEVFAFTWPRLGITKGAFRISNIDKGNLTDGRVRIQAIEDVFGLPNNTYGAIQTGDWIDPVGAPEPVVAQVAYEVPYRDIVRYVPAPDFALLVPGYCFGAVAAVKESGAYYGFDLRSAPAAIGPYAFAETGHFCASGLLATGIGHLTGTMTLNSVSDGVLITVGQHVILGTEWMEVTSYDPLTGVVGIARGIIDTVNVPHTAGERAYFAEINNGTDDEQHAQGETDYYKVLPRTGYGTLDETDATAVSVTFVNRAERPYPPGNFKINTLAYPPNTSNGLTITWAHRDRISQADVLVDTTEASIGPEAGTTYRLRIYNGVTLVRTYSGISGTSASYLPADAVADGRLPTPRLVLDSQRDGFDSYQQHDFTVTRYGLGFKLGRRLGGRAP